MRTENATGSVNFLWIKPIPWIPSPLKKKIQSTLVISTSLILNNRLSRSENLVLRSNFCFLHNIFDISQNQESNYISFVKCGCSIHFSSILQI